MKELKTGTPEDDNIFGSEFDDEIMGLEGQDSLYGGGDDLIHGGPGNDYLRVITVMTFILLPGVLDGMLSIIMIPEIRLTMIP